MTPLLRGSDVPTEIASYRSRTFTCAVEQFWPDALHALAMTYIGTTGSWTQAHRVHECCLNHNCTLPTLPIPRYMIIFTSVI